MDEEPGESGDEEDDAIVAEALHTRLLAVDGRVAIRPKVDGVVDVAKVPGQQVDGGEERETLSHTQCTPSVPCERYGLLEDVTRYIM